VFSLTLVLLAVALERRSTHSNALSGVRQRTRESASLTPVLDRVLSNASARAAASNARARAGSERER
jgi:hypothetical protein